MIDHRQLFERLAVIMILITLAGCNLPIEAPECAMEDLVPPTLDLPAEGAAIYGNPASDIVPGAYKVAFDWDYPVTTCIPNSYKVDISDDSSFADISWGFGTIDTQTAAKWQLFPGCYFWRVAAYTSITDDYGPVSSARSFCIYGDPTPTMTPSPAAGLGSISGWVYVDENINDNRDAGEGSISGAMLTLKPGPCPGGADILTVESESGTGRYTYTGLAAGEYCIATSPIQQTLYPSEQGVVLAAGENLDNINFRYLLSPLETETLTPTPAFTRTPPHARAMEDLNCREGPSPKYKILEYFLMGELAPIVGQDRYHTWWLIRMEKLDCWIWGEKAETEGDTSEVPIVTPPPEPTNTSTPEPGCWVQEKTGLVCIAPCPKDAYPGGACTPS